MLTTFLLSTSDGDVFQQASLISILSITIIFFLVLLIVGIRKSVKLKAENDRLSKPAALSTEDDNKVYRDFREGHLYDSY